MRSVEGEEFETRAIGNNSSSRWSCGGWQCSGDIRFQRPFDRTSNGLSFISELLIARFIFGFKWKEVFDSIVNREAVTVKCARVSVAGGTRRMRRKFLQRVLVQVKICCWLSMKTFFENWRSEIFTFLCFHKSAKHFYTSLFSFILYCSWGWSIRLRPKHRLFRFHNIKRSKLGRGISFIESRRGINHVGHFIFTQGDSELIF